MKLTISIKVNSILRIISTKNQDLDLFSCGWYAIVFFLPIWLPNFVFVLRVLVIYLIFNEVSWSLIGTPIIFAKSTGADKTRLM